MYKAKYFKPHETDCQCGCGLNIDERLLKIIDKARIILGQPIIINSGARCKEHNKRVGGVENSAHIKGLALDIKVNWLDTVYVVKLIVALTQVGFRRFGVNIAKGFVHVDIDDTKKPGIFLY